MKALIVFCEMPEEVSLYVLDDVDEKTRSRLLMFHGRYVNSCDIEPDLSDQMNDFFFDGDGFKRLVAIDRPIIGETFDLVIQCGIFL